jgi:hypothetical protein
VACVDVLLRSMHGADDQEDVELTDVELNHYSASLEQSMADYCDPGLSPAQRAWIRQQLSQIPVVQFVEWCDDCSISKNFRLVYAELAPKCKLPDTIGVTDIDVFDEPGTWRLDDQGNPMYTSSKCLCSVTVCMLFSVLRHKPPVRSPPSAHRVATHMCMYDMPLLFPCFAVATFRMIEDTEPHLQGTETMVEDVASIAALQHQVSSNSHPVMVCDCRHLCCCILCHLFACGLRC